MISNFATSQFNYGIRAQTNPAIIQASSYDGEDGLCSSPLFFKNSYYLYADTDMIVSRYVGADAISNTVAQRYIKTIYETDDYFWEFYIAEGNDASGQSTDHTYVSRKAKNAQFWDNPGVGWVQIGVVANEPQIIGASGVLNGNKVQTWFSSIIGPNEGLDAADNVVDGIEYTYRVYYSANGPTIQSQYSVYWRASNDLITWVEGQDTPIITDPSSPTLYLIPKVIIVDATHWYMTLATSSGSFVGVYPLDVYRSVDKGITWTLIHQDILAGDDVCQYGSSDIWYESGKWWFAMTTDKTGTDKGSSRVAYWGTPTHIKITRYPVGKSIRFYSITDWEDIDTLTDEGIKYTGSQKCEQGLFCWGGKRSYLGRDFFIVASAKWKHQSALASTVEHFESDNLLVYGVPVTATQGAIRQTDVFPSYISHYFTPTQPASSEDVVDPIEYISGIAGTVVDSPTTSFLQHIDTTNGYVSWVMNVITDPENFGVLLKYDCNNSLAGNSNHGICQIGPHSIEWIGTSGTIRVRIIGDNGNIKMYRVVIGILSASISSQADCNLVKSFGFLFRGGVLKLIVIPNTNLTITTQYVKETDQAITALATSELVELGHSTGSLGSSNALKPMGPLVCYNGVDNATEENILRTDII